MSQTNPRSIGRSASETARPSDHLGRRPNRRELILGALGTAVAGGFFTGRSPFGLPRSISLAAPSTDYRALVCVYLVGGNDSFNMLVPTGQQAYSAYAAARSDLAIPLSDLLPIGTVGSPAQEMGFHPNLPRLRQRYLTGDLGLVANIGPLNAPTTLAEVAAGASHVPPHLFSHSDQQRYWQGSRAEGLQAPGWGAGLVERLAASAGGTLPAAISMSGSNQWQTSENSGPYGLQTSGAVEYMGFESGLGAARMELFEQLINRDSERVLVDAFAERHRRSIEFGALANQALLEAPNAPEPLPEDNALAAQLSTIARLASQHAELGASRQIFFCRMHGFDTHAGHLEAQPELFRQLDDALASFQDSLDAFGLSQKVTTFTASDFGRSLSSNGKGCDHGWGGHQLVLGGAVAGGAAYGTWPTLALGGPDDVGFGRLLPTTAVDQMSATLARWMGLGEEDLAGLFPNLPKFGSANLGFLS